eukprot:gene12650-12778_t
MHSLAATASTSVTAVGDILGGSIEADVLLCAIATGGSSWLTSVVLPLALVLLLLGGALADRFGGRAVIAAGGLGEGVALPSMSNMVAAHVPPAAKARALGMSFTGFHTGNLVGLVLSPLILVQFGWKALFYTFVNHWGYFIYLNWMPSYFSRALGFDLRSSSFLSLVPWLVMAVGSSAAGFLADSLIASGHSITTVRKAVQSVSMLVPAVALLFLANPEISPAAAVAAMTAALGVTSLGQAGFVANMSDIAPKQAGQMFGLCNTFGCLSGILGVLSVGWIVEKTGSFVPVFQITAAMYVVAVICWNLLCTGERVF